MSEKKASQSNVIEEQDRPNNYISSLLYSRATVFYPAAKITESMKNKLIEVAESGGTDFESPLGKIDIKSYGIVRIASYSTGGATIADHLLGIDGGVGVKSLAEEDMRPRLMATKTG